MRKLRVFALAALFPGLLVPLFAARNAAAGPEATTITLLGGAIPAIGPTIYGSSPSHYLEILDLVSLDWYAVTTTDEDLSSIVSRFRLESGRPLDPAGIFAVWVYTDGPVIRSGEVPDEWIGGASVLSVTNDGGHRHQYFEPSRAVMQEIPLYSVDVLGPYSVEAARIMHFAATGKVDLPLESTIYQFASDIPVSWLDHYDGQPLDRTLTIEALLDPLRSNGARALGIGSDSLYESVLGYVPSEAARRCGNLRKCPVSKRQHCTGHPQYDCYGPNTDCSTSAIADTSVELGLEIDVQCGQLWEFRDVFLMNYESGQRYKNYYYIFSIFVKLDLRSMLEYATFMPHALSAVAVLMDGGDKEVVVTQDVFDSSTSIIQNHRDVNNLILQGILDEVEADLFSYRGLTKRQFLAAFSK